MLAPLGSTVGKESLWSLGRGPGQDSVLPPTAQVWGLNPRPGFFPSVGARPLLPQEGLPVRTEGFPHPQGRLPKPVPKKQAGASLRCLGRPAGRVPKERPLGGALQKAEAVASG